MKEKVRQILSCFKDLENDKDNKDIVKTICNKTKELIYDNGNLTITKDLLDIFEEHGMFIGIQNNTENVPDQYNIYVAYNNKIGVVVDSVSKKDLINE